MVEHRERKFYDKKTIVLQHTLAFQHSKLSVKKVNIWEKLEVNVYKCWTQNFSALKKEVLRASETLLRT